MYLMNYSRLRGFDREATVAKFLTKVRKTSTCWVWEGARVSGAKKGYGVVSFKGKPHLSHRVSWILFVGPVPNGLCVCHSCDVKDCVNPKHLFLGTHTDNMRDMESKGRSIHPKGSAHGRAKLTDAAVAKIRKDLANGVAVRALSRKYGVARPSIRRIKDGTGWK